ncbi:hypothetical protein TNCV_2516481 [Trichonephila clavipes]|nr:hypothetical protein TNCV_2516481 [Trichonephila clavipes]
MKIQVLITPSRNSISLRHPQISESEFSTELTNSIGLAASRLGFYSIFSLLEIATRVKQDISSPWSQDPVHELYEGNHPGAALLGTNRRRYETTLARLRSGHT